MASTVKNMKSMPKSYFYTDDSVKSITKHEGKMSDNFYKEAAAEVVRDAAGKKVEGVQQPATLGSHMSSPEIPEAESEVTPESPVPESTPASPAPASEAPQEQPAHPVVEDTPDDGFDDFDDFDFVEAYDDDPVAADERMLPENSAASAIKCAFLGVGGGGGKLAKAFLDLGFHKTLLINTTVKDQPEGVSAEHFLLLPGADGVGKDIELGKKVLENNSALVEDAIRTRIGKVDWLFVLAGGGGGTGSASRILDGAFNRYLRSVEAAGQVVYVVTRPTAQELLNPTIASNYEHLLSEVALQPHIMIDNEKQLQLLRGKVGMLDLYPSANRNFAKLLWQVLKLADETSPIQSFDSKDLERVLSTTGRMVIGSTVARDVNKQDLGSILYQGCLKSSPCPAPAGKASTGVMLLIVTPAMASNPSVSKNLEAAFSYVGGRTDTLFSGVYVKQRLPGLIAISVIAGF
jgi:cell division GTPase FtsZ